MGFAERKKWEGEVECWRMIRASETVSPVCLCVCAHLCVRVRVRVCVKWSYSAVLGMVSVHLENLTKPKSKNTRAYGVSDFFL